MVYRTISADMKRRALQLLDLGWEMHDIADTPGLSKKSTDRWVDNYETHGRVDPPSVLRGRPRILTQDALNDLQELIQESPSLFLDEIGEWLALYHNQPISTTALHDNLRDIGLTYKLVCKAALSVTRLSGLFGCITSLLTSPRSKLLSSTNPARMVELSYGNMAAQRVKVIL
ncbi:hypothetical protein D9615_006901 [Tricholomella constricta]|uniref:Transposase n=1 Tax=Tricholomella constricta TaxID=117010 RepID=A0A8H5H8U2_9AGAR|nr:hypothetical protein D9615_006901 [Tricholomella constricta]